MTQHYYAPRRIGGQWHGVIYHYDPTGNHEQTVWVSPDGYGTREEAVDAAADHIEDADLEATLGEIRPAW